MSCGKCDRNEAIAKALGGAAKGIEPAKIKANRIGMFTATFPPTGDQPLGEFMALNIHVLPQAVRLIFEVDTEVDRHAN